MEACLYGHTDTVHALVSGGAQVDLQDVVRCSICVLW